MPDELKDAPVRVGAQKETPLPLQPLGTASAAPGDHRPRRPSWLRAALWSLVVLVAGSALGAAGYRAERAYSIQLPAVTRAGEDLRIAAHAGRELSGLGLHGSRLIWQDGASIEYMDLGDGDVRLLGPGAGMRATWDPAIGDRYAVWFEAERPASIAAQAVAYDTRTGRRWTLGDVGAVRSYPAISGDLAVWSSAAQAGKPAIWGARIGGRWAIPIADGDGAPVVSGGLVVWARGWTGPFAAREIVSGTTWPVGAAMTTGKLTGMALAGRTLVWGQAADGRTPGLVAAVDVDGGGTTTIARSVDGLAGPSYDGATVVWGERAGSGSRVMGRRPGSGEAFAVASVRGTVTEVAVSGDTVAWIQQTAGRRFSIVVRQLPR